MQDRGQGKGDAPVFVFGALRSGTTVFRLMLDAHPRLINPGEADFLFDYLIEDSQTPCHWRYELNNLREDRVFQSSGLEIPAGKDGLDLLLDFLGQYREAGGQALTLNIHRNVARLTEIFPNARIIHMLRDPRDVARSAIGMGWAGTLYHGVGQWISCEKEWDCVCKSLDREQHISLRYEDLISEPERELRRVCDFVGVGFEASMLNYHKDTTYNPPDASLIEQWKHKSSDYEISLVEGRVSDIMQRRGYEIAGRPHFPASLERAKLNILNRALVWHQAIRRYGLQLFLLEKLARRLGLKDVHHNCRGRMRECDMGLLK